MIGDFGELTTWRTSDGDIVTSSWMLVSSNNSLADLIIIKTRKDSSGNTVSYVEITQTIDTVGNIQNDYRTQFLYESGLYLEINCYHD